MQYWHTVLDEVLHKNDDTHPFLFTNQGELSDDMESYSADSSLSGKTKNTRDLRTYYLDNHFPAVYLTKREAECAFWIVQDRTITEAACHMQLSARTVEFYVKNMKLKLSCASKKELIVKLLQSSLLQQLEKDGMRIVKH